MSKNRYRGSNFDDFLKEEGILEEVEIRAAKRAIALQLEKLMKSQSLSKKAMAARMRTSRAALDRLLDTSNTSVTLRTLGKAAQVVGRKLKIELLPAA
jgi:DNA-binding Xre family transcriptional regulator